MSITINATRRARGMIFAQVQLGDEATECRLVAHGSVGEGERIPLVVQRGDDEGVWTLMLPALTVTQSVRLEAVDADGATLEELSQKFGPMTARVGSPRQMLHRRGRAPWQLPDERTSHRAWDIRVERLVATRSGQEICQGHARLTATSPDLLAGDVRVRILEARGRDVAASAWICLCDETLPVAEYKGFYVRHVEFSLRVPATTTTLVPWVEPVDGADLPDGFACLGPRVTASLREAWRAQATPARDDDGYDGWYHAAHEADDDRLAMQRASARDLASTDARKAFSVVCVVRDASPETLRETVESVLAQTYGDFELLLVNAAPGNRKLGSAVRGAELADARVRCVPLAADFGPAAATSEGLDAATGTFACLLAEGDLLAPDALWCLARTIERHPDADVLYTDEDVLERGRHVRPQLKPDWDPDLLLSGDSLGNMLCVRTLLLQDMQTMTSELDGAERFRVALYATARARRVCHVARVLYHQRAPRDAQTFGTARQASGLVALRQHLEGTTGTPRPSARVPQCFEVSWELPAEPPLVSVIVLNRDNVPALDRCLRVLRERTDYANHEVIIVENGSVDPETFAYYRAAEAADERVRTIFFQLDGPFDEARLIDFGVSRARGELLLFLHNDAEPVDATWMGRLASLVLREGTAAASARLVRPDGTIDCCGLALAAQGPLALGRYTLAADEADPVLSSLHAATMAPGTCLMVRKDAFDDAGGIRLAFGGRLGVEDLCLRLWGKGLRVVVDPQVSVTHHRPLAADVRRVPEAAHLQAVGRLWDVWPFSDQAIDPMLGASVDAAGAYRSLPE